VAVVRTGGIGLAFLAEVLVARWLGAESYGVFAWLAAAVLVASTVARTGLDTLLLRLVPAYVATGAFGLLRGLLRASFAWVAVIGVGLALFARLVAALWAGPEHAPWRDAGATAAAVGVPLVALGVWRAHVLMGLGHTERAVFIDRWTRPAILVAGAAVGLAWFPDAGSAGLATWIATAAAGIALALGTWWGRSLEPHDLRGRAPESRWSEWRSAGAVLALTAGLRIAMDRADVLLVGVLRPAEVAPYAAATRLAEVVTFGLTTVNLVVAPRISALWATGDEAALRRLLVRASRAICAVSLVAVAALLLAEVWALGLFGPGFVAGGPFLRVLLWGQLVAAITGPVGFVLSMTGHERVLARVIAVTTVLGLAAHAVAIPLWGASGAAWATSGARAASNLALAWVVWRTLRLRVWPW
jgi:O-antigen/teichoic acid export membrane protein